MYDTVPASKKKKPQQWLEEILQRESPSVRSSFSKKRSPFVIPEIIAVHPDNNL